MNPSFKDIAAFRATAPTPTEAMSVMLGEESGATHIPTFLEVIPLVLGMPYSPPPYAYRNIKLASEPPPAVQAELFNSGFRSSPHDLPEQLGKMNASGELDMRIRHMAEAYLEKRLAHGALRYIIEEINRLRVSDMRSPETPDSTSNQARLTFLLWPIDDMGLRRALDEVCMVTDAFVWMKSRCRGSVDAAGTPAVGGEEILRERDRGVQEVIRQIAEFADGTCAHRLLRRIIRDLL